MSQNVKNPELESILSSLVSKLKILKKSDLTTKEDAKNINEIYSLSDKVMRNQIG